MKELMVDSFQELVDDLSDPDIMRQQYGMIGIQKLLSEKQIGN